MTESYILCEGYHDRAFWKGLLLSLGCKSLGIPGTTPKDPWGDPVRGGQYAFQGHKGGFIRVVPAGSRRQLLPLARIRISQRADRPLRLLIVNSDSDQNADGTPAHHGELAFDTLLGLARGNDSRAAKSHEHVIAFDEGEVQILAFPWRSSLPPAPGLPNQQSLERLVCGVLATVHPDRPAPVDHWLKSRPAPPPSNPKEHAFSYLAGWYAAYGSYEGFFEALWNEPAIAQGFRTELERQGVWALLEDIAEAH